VTCSCEPGRVAALRAGVLIDVTCGGCGGGAGGYWGSRSRGRVLGGSDMGGDVATLAAEMTPYVSTAVGAS